MYVINAQNVNDALSQGTKLLMDKGQVVPSRGGPTLEMDAPVATVYHNPLEMVLMNSARDANPFFHLMESLWILAAREDVKFLTEFNARMVDYSDDGVVFNAPYGYRLRTGVSYTHDQLEEIIAILKIDPMSRQAVGQIWDDCDLQKPTKDKACNMSTVFRVRNNKLCLTVYNRSNDMIWGAYGANVVQFSMILQYVAAKLNMAVGTYTQVSNSYHVYTEGPGGEVWDKMKNIYQGQISDLFGDDCNPYSHINETVLMNPNQMPSFEHDLKQFFSTYDLFGIDEVANLSYWESDYFKELVMPMLAVHRVHKNNGAEKALEYTNHIQADDWLIAATDWLTKRIK
tara:strand:- start:35207 stop:36235 length:1029 start_codon:yes stop_codon:yes gene_type:complete